MILHMKNLSLIHIYGEDRGNMKEGGMQDGNGRGQAPGGMENPSRNAPPTDQTGDTSKENGSVEGETNL